MCNIEYYKILRSELQKGQTEQFLVRVQKFIFKFVNQMSMHDVKET